MKDIYMKHASVTKTVLITAAALMMSSGNVFSASPASSTTTTSPVAGGTTVSVVAAQELALGWSAKKQILGKTIYNEQKEKVGKIDDLIITPDNAVSYAIVGAGGFVGLGKHDVAIPVAQLKDQSGNIVLPGATKDSIKSLPEFQYAKK